MVVPGYWRDPAATAAVTAAATSFGFTAITALLIPGLAQTVLSYRGASLIPGLGGNRPVMVGQEIDPRQSAPTAVPRP